MSRYEWLRQCILGLGVALLLLCSPALAKKDPNAPQPIHEPGPSTQTPIDNDLTVEKPTGPLMLKNADQINLLNALSMMDMSHWASTLKRNRPLLNDEFLQVMANRSRDAMTKALAAHKGNDDKAKNGYVEISFRYALLADLCAVEMHRDRIYRLELAKAYAQIKDGVPMAMAIIGNILITEPEHLGARMLSGWLREKNGDFYGAMVDYQHVIKKNANYADAWLAIAKANLVVSDFPKAKDALRRAVACTGGSSEAMNEARTLMERLEHPEQLPPPSSAQILPGPKPGAPETAEQFVALADTAMREHRVDEARKYYQRAVQMSATNSNAHMGLGDIHFRNKEFMKAIDEYDLAAKYAPSSAEPMYYMGLSCEAVYESTRSPMYLDRAIECMTSAVRIKPDYPAARAAQERLLSKKSQ